MVSTMNEATDFCAWMCSKLPGVRLSTEIEDDFDADCVRGKYKLYDSNLTVECLDPIDPWSDSEDDANESPMPSRSDSVVVNGREMSLKTAAAIFGNGGYTRLPAQARASRFYSYAFRPITMETDCVIEDCTKWST